MQPDHLWNILVGTTIMDAATSGYPTRVARRPMTTKLKQLLDLRTCPPETWTAADRELVKSVRELAKILMSGPLLHEETAEIGIGLGVSKELMVCLAAFAEPDEGAQSAGSPAAASSGRDVMLSRLRVL
jgi:hypothetical protein